MSFVLRRSMPAFFMRLNNKSLYSFARSIRKPTRMTEALSEQPIEALKQNKGETVSFSDDEIQRLYKKEQAPYNAGDEGIQMEIMRAAKLEELFEYYKQNKKDFDIVNYCTFLDRSVKLHNKIEDKNVKKLKEFDEIRDIVETLRTKVSEMNNFSLSNYMTNLAKIDFIDHNLVEKIVNASLKNKTHFQEKPLAYITWALGKYRIRNIEFLDMVADKVLTQSKEKAFKSRSLANIFWGMSRCDYKNPKILQLIEDRILKEPHLIHDYIDVNLIYAAYNNYHITNWDVLDTLSGFVIKHIKKMTFRNITNIANFCANLNYLNPPLMDTIERELISRLKDTAEFKSILESDDEATPIGLKPSAGLPESKSKELSTETINNTDISQVLVSFCRLKVIKAQLFELLEVHFIKNLDKATPASIQSYAFAHSALCLDIMKKYHENKKDYLHRSAKNLKKYNNTFYEVLTPFLISKSSEWKPEVAYSLLISASRPGVSKRALKRGILEFGNLVIPSIAALKETQSIVKFEKFVYGFYLTLQKFVYKPEQLQEIKESFSKTGINVELIETVYREVLDSRSTQALEENRMFLDEPAEGKEEDSEEEGEGEKVGKDKKQAQTEPKKL